MFSIRIDQSRGTGRLRAVHIVELFETEETIRPKTNPPHREAHDVR